jgi:uncharacterized protein (DUF488 family)
MTDVVVPWSSRSLADLTQAVFGEALTMTELFDVVGFRDLASAPRSPAPVRGISVGSIGYERFKDNRDFAARLRRAGIDRLIDVRELPISRRRGYAKTALGEAMAGVGVEYVHVRSLGNPKPFRDLYKSGRVTEGRELYKRHLLGESRHALESLAELLQDGKPSALMCVEHEPSVCHRTVILEALRDEMGLAVEVEHLA